MPDNQEFNINNMKTAVIYARVSSINDRQNTKRQICDLQAYASNNNYSIVNVFSEHISGATKNAERHILNVCLSYCVDNNVDIVMFSELSRLGRNVLEVIEIVKWFADNKVNAYFQKEQLTLLNQNGEVAPTTTILISCLGMVAQIERENIKFRLNSGRAKYIADGGRLGRKEGSVKSQEKREIEYKQVIRELKKGTSVRRTAKLCDVSVSTVQRVKKDFEI